MYKYFNSWGRYDNQICTLVAPSKWWQYHYDFGDCALFTTNECGSEMVNYVWHLRGIHCPILYDNRRETKHMWNLMFKSFNTTFRWIMWFISFTFVMETKPYATVLNE